jgi:predicted ribosome quality control (RQC) complex YloA/Tae2 family protein
MLSLLELARAVAILDRDWAGARVERVVQPAERLVVVTLYAGERGTANVALCADPKTARLSLCEARPPAPPTPPAFAQLLKARIGGARLASVRVVDADRQAALCFEGEAGPHELLLSILGPRTNLYLLDAGARIVGSLRPIAESRRDLALGAVWRSPESRPPGTSEDRFADVPDAGFFAALEVAAAGRAAEGEQDSLARRIERALRRATQSIEKKLALLQGDAAAADSVAMLRRQGDLLKGALAGIKRGVREVRARDFATGEEIVIALDPLLSPKQNLDALYTRARKAEKRSERALREQGDAESRRDALAALAADFASLPAEDGAALAAFAERPEMARLLARYAAEPASTVAPAAKPAPAKRVWRLGKQEVPARLVPRVYRSSSGLEIWVGRSDEGNDLLSTRLARGNDLFFHLEASPGSHVVLRTEGRSDPPSEALLEAAELAVHFSKQRKVTEAHVTVSPIKNVSKPRGAKPGLVYVAGGRSLRLRRDEKRLQAILASRSDDSAE